MTCKQCMEKLMALDKGDSVPVLPAFHLSGCPSCMKTWTRLSAVTKNMQAYAGTEQVNVTDDVMKAIEETAPDRQVRPGVSICVWLAGGLVLLGTMFFSAFSEPFVSARTAFGDAFLMPLSLVSGIILSVYIVFFIGSQLSRISSVRKIITASEP